MPSFTPARTRRAFLAESGAVVFSASDGFAQAPGRLAFEVWRKGERIGLHTVDLAATPGGGWTARIAAAFVVRLGPIPVFHYRHDATETWSAPDRFAALDARTVSNGKVETVAARHVGEAVRIVRSNGADVLAPARAAPLTHWNREALSRPLFNPQTGVLARETVTRHPGTAPYADGRTITATAYVLTGDAEITDWYDAAGGWVALRGKVSDGSWLDYRRLA